ncbi:phage tail assembly chaperone [Pseudomonas sp. MAFF 301350]|uniref:Phage tail assembly chaperone n=1 Tax=Pseudomonas aegrilactucae TaxID=2854028 RepID=A0A9Q3AE53_9PSED|nr:phage tail assembly chaperone [Pseudomonas aegrilactucae]
MSTAERMWRDTNLAGLIWLRDRHRDQLEIDAPSTLTPEQFVDLLMFMQALRDWPQSELFPSIEHRPLSPAWLADLAP